jgi:hypothetical protein
MDSIKVENRLASQLRDDILNTLKFSNKFGVADNRVKQVFAQFPTEQSIAEMTGAELINLRITKIFYHLDKYLKAISFEMNDGTRSPQYGNAQELTQYFEIPHDKDISKIIVRQSDQSIRGLSLIDANETTIIDI